MLGMIFEMMGAERIMQVLATCLVVVCACSCRRGVQDSHPPGSSDAPTRKGEIGRIVHDHFADYAAYQFEIRGPLTPAQIGEELTEEYDDRPKPQKPQEPHGISKGFENSDLGKAWGEIMTAYRDGDELYFFISDRRSWAELRGIKGYILVRRNEVVDTLVTGIN